MDLLKALRRTTIITAAAVLAYGATPAYAVLGTGAVGHISASIVTALTIAEVNAMAFGNMAPPTAAGTLVLSPLGQLTATGGIVPVATGTGGVTASTPEETAAQEPGFFNVVTDSQSTVYISFSDPTGHIIDPVHPSNNIPLFGPDNPATASDFFVDTFTVANDTSTTGYDGAQVNQDSFGYYPVAIANHTGSHIKVGATLHDPFTAPTILPGKYVGTYFIMVSY